MNLLKYLSSEFNFTLQLASRESPHHTFLRACMVGTRLPYTTPDIVFGPILQRDILSVILYFDIFRHPVTAEEIYRFLPSNSTSPTAIAETCKASPLNKAVAFYKDHFFISARKSACVEERIRKEQTARKRWRIALLMAKLIGAFPFVRGIFVSGELSKGVASRNGDIDYVILTAPHRLWICRSLLILFKKTVLLNSKKYFCLNHFISEDRLEVEEQNIYSALELATLKPLRNINALREYVEANAWVRDYFPNWKMVDDDEKPAEITFIQRLLEIPFGSRLGDALDRWLMSRWQELWRKRYSHLEHEKRERLFRCERYISTAYGQDFLNEILSQYSSRLQLFGVTTNLSDEPTTVTVEVHG